MPVEVAGVGVDGRGGGGGRGLDDRGGDERRAADGGGAASAEEAGRTAERVIVVAAFRGGRLCDGGRGDAGAGVTGDARRRPGAMRVGAGRRAKAGDASIDIFDGTGATVKVPSII